MSRRDLTTGFFDNVQIVLFVAYIVFMACASTFLHRILQPTPRLDPWDILTAEDLSSGAACEDFGIKAPYPYTARKSYKVTLNDVFLAIKTTYKNQNRLDLIYKTWYKYSPKETYFVTDKATSTMIKQFGDKIIESDCHHSYRGKSGLECKTKIEYSKFLFSSKNKWFCNLDDDMYLNVPRLLQLLHCFNPDEDWYIGSISKLFVKYPLSDGKQRKYTFAQGQIYCLTRKSVIRILTIFGNAAFHKLNSLNDDKIIGYLNDILLNNKLTIVKLIYHHGVELRELEDGHLPYVVSFSYCFKRNKFINVTGFPIAEDPTRMKSAHCHLYPDPETCPQVYFPR